MLVISGTESNDTLLSLVTNIDSNKHSLLGDLAAEVEAPQVSSELGVDLSEDVDVDPVVVFLDSFA